MVYENPNVVKEVYLPIDGRVGDTIDTIEKYKKTFGIDLLDIVEKPKDIESKGKLKVIAKIYIVDLYYNVNFVFPAIIDTEVAGQVEIYYHYVDLNSNPLGTGLRLNDDDTIERIEL